MNNTDHFTAADHAWMAQALQLAKQGQYTTAPNPNVGCVLVKAGQLLATAWHEQAGEAHAEVLALATAGSEAQGATAYVTLEPCAHQGRTGPCAQALIDAGVSKVVAAMQDPNPLVAGKGAALLQEAGIEYRSGLLTAQAEALNPGFIQRMQTGKPLLRLKTAASLDGRTALANGLSNWITGAAARADVQHWRARSGAILTGIGTLLHDDPALNQRMPAVLRQPLRVLLDSQLRCPTDAQWLTNPGDCLIVHASKDENRIKALTAAGAELLYLPNSQGQVDLCQLIKSLGERQINECHVEAGAELNGALLTAGLVDEWLHYLAPKVLGSAAKPLFALASLTEMAQCHQFSLQEQRQFGDDFRFIFRPIKIVAKQSPTTTATD